MQKTHAAPAMTAVILAGGKARRMAGRDKGLISIAGKPMIEYVIEAISPQISHLLINANRSQNDYAHYGFPVIADAPAGFHGPLAGMASALQVTETAYMLALPCDSPYAPCDLAQRLYESLLSENAEISVAHDGRRLQPVFCLLKRSLLPSMRAYLESGERKIDRWFARHNMAITDFSDKRQAFININSREDIVRIEAELAGHVGT